jgi:NADH:ubiquinone oxidoreductase subunit 6 (subunit J)
MVRSVMQTKKPFHQSRTIIGAVVMLIAFLASLFRVEIPAEELATAEDDIAIAWEAVAALIGFLLTIWGRIKASRQIGISGAK